MIVLNDAIKGFTEDQDKLIPPDLTVKRFRDRLKRLDIDILRETIRIDSGRLGIPVYFSVCGEDALSTIGTRKQMGKGASPIQAEASAVMELAERFSLFSFIKEETNFKISTYKELLAEAMPFGYLPLSVNDHDSDIEKAEKIFSDIPLRWAPATDLSKKKEFWVPWDWFYNINEYNGSSAGNCNEEAILQGICEVVERHVSAIVSKEKIKLPLIDIDIKDQVALDLINKYRKNGIEIYISDFSLNTGIPTIGILAYDPTTFPEKSEIVWTAGTATSPIKALIRALTEVAQLAGDFDTDSKYIASGLPKLKSLEEASFIINTKKRKKLSELPDISHSNMKIEIENMLAALGKAGFEVIVVDITHPLLKVPAFYTIIPGARFRERSSEGDVNLYICRLISEYSDPIWALQKIDEVESIISEKYYTRFYKGLLNLSIGDIETARREFESSLTLSPKGEDEITIHIYLAHVLKEMDNYKEAIQILQKVRKIDPERSDIYNMMGFCLFKLKHHEEAIRCFKKVIELDPGSAIDYANIASNYKALNRYEEAIYYYQIALEIDPSIGFARKALEDILSKVKMNKNAKTTSKEI